MIGPVLVPRLKCLMALCYNAAELNVERAWKLDSCRALLEDI